MREREKNKQHRLERSNGAVCADKRVTVLDGRIMYYVKPCLFWSICKSILSVLDLC